MAKVVIDDRIGTKLYYDDKDKLHRIEGPALIKSSGSMIWCSNGLQSRLDMPACVWENGTMWWRVEDIFHRHKGPAVDKPNGLKYWWNYGEYACPKL